MVLEVGLGGRLDAVNIIDADVAIVTTVAIDHVDYLGATREAIGREKAGIFRTGRVAICADRDPPHSLLDHAAAIGATLLRLGVDYDFTVSGPQWSYRGPGGARHGLPHPALRGDYQLVNAATALAAVDCVAPAPAARHGRGPRRAGRGRHCPAASRSCRAARCVCSTSRTIRRRRVRWPSGLGAMGFHPQTHAVFGIMADKDIDDVIAALLPRVERWIVATLPPPRGASASMLRDRLEAAGVAPAAIREFDDPAAAYRAACGASTEADRIIVFGSFPNGRRRAFCVMAAAA